MGAISTVQNLHQRAFACAVFAEQRQDLPLLDLQAHIIVGFKARKCLTDPFKLNKFCHEALLRSMIRDVSLMYLNSLNLIWLRGYCCMMPRVFKKVSELETVPKTPPCILIILMALA